MSDGNAYFSTSETVIRSTTNYYVLGAVVRELSSHDTERGCVATSASSEISKPRRVVQSTSLRRNVCDDVEY